MKADSRVRALALLAVPIPVFLLVFINIMPVKSMEESQIVENYFSGQNHQDDINYKDELVNYLYC